MEKAENNGEYIEVTELDPDFKSEVMKHEDAKGLNACFACGTCTAGCPIHEIFPEYDPRKLAKMVKLGMREELLTSPYIWYCATCHNCEQHCPQNVKFYSILNVLKNMKQIIKTGLVFTTDEALFKKRRSFSLPDLKLDGSKVKKIIKLTGIDKIKSQEKD
jgi:heterodisulfide reductase subunit C